MLTSRKSRRRIPRPTASNGGSGNSHLAVAPTANRVGDDTLRMPAPREGGSVAGSDLNLAAINI